MNKEIYNRFIEAEKEWEWKIIEIYNEYFSEYQNDYKKMAKLMIVIRERFENNLDNNELSIIYTNLESDISGWSNENLNEEEFNNFCELADNLSIERVISN